MAVGSSDPIDVHVGGRLRLARTAVGLPLNKIGEALGVSSQQIQKYEKGVNRLGARRLYQLARLFDVSVGFFFRDIPAEIADSQSIPARHNGPHKLALESAHIGPGGGNQETLRLVSTFLQISDRALRAEIIALVAALQKSLPEDRTPSP